ncbi:MAG: substrate-binding domain-containing protein [Lachnospiraceae bacterium]
MNLLFKDNVVYVGSDENEAGQQQADALAENFKEKGQTDIKYVLFQGILGQDSVIKRTESVLVGLEEAGITEVDATAPISCDWGRAKALENGVGKSTLMKWQTMKAGVSMIHQELSPVLERSVCDNVWILDGTRAAKRTYT